MLAEQHCIAEEHGDGEYAAAAGGMQGQGEGTAATAPLPFVFLSSF
jgi:hypothetical protein